VLSLSARVAPFQTAFIALQTTAPVPALFLRPPVRLAVAGARCHRVDLSALIGVARPQIGGGLPGDVDEGDHGQGGPEVPGDMGGPDHDQDGRKQAAAERDDQAPWLAPPLKQASRAVHEHSLSHSPNEQTIGASPVIQTVSPLSDVQFSRFAEMEVAKLLT